MSSAGAYCVICGSGPFVKVGLHTRQVHGLSRKEYKKLYPGVLMTGEASRHGFALQAKETFAGKRRRKRVCKRGHALRAPNIVYTSAGWRRCKTCARDAARESMRRYRERRGPTTTGTCPECGGPCLPASPRCKHCSGRRAVRIAHARRRS